MNAWRNGASLTRPRGRRARKVIASMVAVCGMAVALPLLSVQVASAATVPVIDWSMPDRFVDGNGDGIVDYPDGTADAPTGVLVQPSTWTAKLDACASSTVGAATYEWRVVEQPLAVTGGPGCGDFELTVPEEGTYRVELQITDGNGSSGWVRQEVVVQDFLIVSLGDSYGSGEGSPDVPLDLGFLAAEEEAWAELGAAWDGLFEIELKVANLDAAIAEYERLDALPCDVDGEWSCFEKTGALAGQWIVIAYEATVVGIIAAWDTITAVWDLAVNAVQAVWATVEAVVWKAEVIFGKYSATWQNETCHRSGRAGSALAARQLEDADPRTSVTFVHLACSGATMTYGLLGWYQGTEPVSEDVTNEACNPAPGGTRPAGCVRPQLEVAQDLVGDREVDAMYVSIGGNDAHFADIIIACILQEPCSEESVVSVSNIDAVAVAQDDCPGLSSFNPFYLFPTVGPVLASLCADFMLGLEYPTMTARELIDEGVDGDFTSPISPQFPGLATAYAAVDARIEQLGLLTADRGERLFLSEYVDAVRNQAGAFCDFGTMGFQSIPGLSWGEAWFIDSYIVRRLTGAIQAATAAHDWTFVDGVASRFRNKGYCADNANRQLVQLQETFFLEGRFQGMVHPNYKGHEAYRDAILNKLRTELYPNGLDARRPDQPVYADAGRPYTVPEGSSVTLTNETFDGDGDPVTYAWRHDAGVAATIAPANGATPVLTGVDDVAAGTLTLTATEADSAPAGRTDTATFSVTNVAPVLGTMTGPVDPVLIDTPTQVSVPFTDAGVADTHGASIDWGDGTTVDGTVQQGAGSGTVTGSHTYASPGIYTVTVRLSDDDGGAAVPVEYQYVVVYDPDGGFVTGAGWFDSPSGAYTPEDPTDPDVVGRAHFGFVSKYQKGATVPQGNTSFRFQAADLEFDSTSYGWMVIAGEKAIYKGVGTVNGEAGYAFQLSAVDGGTGGADDRLGVRIWDQLTGVVVYDNQQGDDVTADAKNVIGAGSISVKAPSKK